MAEDMDDLAGLLDEALGLAEVSLKRELAPPDQMFAQMPDEEVPAMVAAAEPVKAASKPPASWMDRQLAALQDGESRAEAGVPADDFEDDPV